VYFHGSVSFFTWQNCKGKGFKGLRGYFAK
jgi:hypothetical protein